MYVLLPKKHHRGLGIPNPLELITSPLHAKARELILLDSLSKYSVLLRDVKSEFWLGKSVFGNKVLLH
jgi:hypothetical protein